MFWGGKLKIKELFNFEDIQKVIEIGNIKDEKEMVEKFVISSNLEDYLLDFIEYLKGNKPEENISINVIGNYGTGKSHLLAFVSLILAKPDLTQYIQNDNVREAFQDLNRSFLIVKYELPAVQTKSLASIFFYRVRKQLKENYGIEIRPMDIETDEKDTKELIEEILLKIKEKYPASGLMVIFDEYSDFIKQKHSADQNYDLQFTRQLAESSKKQDFILMISMQEHIFSNPEYQDKAELISKIEKRFLKIMITSENIEEIIAKRIVRKDQNQIQELKKLFDGLKSRFNNIVAEEDRYIKLFPIHPYIIDVILQLSLFENRSTLQFITQEIKTVMENEFPSFITFDMIYDEMIESEPTIKNRPDVKPITGVLKSLNDIINRLDSNYRERAKRLIKSLAILNLITPPDNKGEKRGDTPEKLAENLFLIPKSTIIEPSEDVRTILNMIIKKSEGQFIGKNEKEDIYYIDLAKKIDYEQIINNKASNMDDLPYVNEKFVENFLLEELDLKIEKGISYWDSSRKYILNDSVSWKERNSFREGILSIEIGYKLKIDETGDYSVSILGYGKKEVNNSQPKQIIIKPKYSDNLAWSMKRLAAIEELIRTRTYLEIMKNKKRILIDEELKKGFRDAIQNAGIQYNGKNFTLDEIGINTEINLEIFSQIKEKLLGEDLIKDYPEYPRFKSKLSSMNIKNTIEGVIKDISQKEGVVKDLLTQSTNILMPLGLYREGMIDVNESEYAKQILNMVANTSVNIAIEDIVNKFKEKPCGLQKEITYLIIAVLLRNGDLMLSSKHGKTYSSSEFSELFRSGLYAFKDIKYIRKEEGPISEVQLLFDALDLDRSLLQIRKNWPIAYRDYMDRIEKIERDIKNIKTDFGNIKHSMEIGLPLVEIEEQIKTVEETGFSNLKINNLNELNKFDYSKERLKEIENSYYLINKINGLLKDCSDFIIPGMDYMKCAIDWINNDFFKESDKKALKDICIDSKEIVTNIRKLLKEDERKPLKGKIELFKEKYKEIYYHTHKELVGDGVDWILLDDLKTSSEFSKLNILKDVNSINPSIFRDLQLEIADLKDVECDDFRVDELDTSYHCHCMFPNGNYDPNINQKITKISDDADKLLKSWEKQILVDIDENKEKVSLLDEEEKSVIQNIIDSGKLPDEIDYSMIKGINNLLKGIEFEDIDINDLYAALTSEKDSLKADEFIKIIESYLSNKIKTNNAENIRIRVVKNSAK